MPDSPAAAASASSTHGTRGWRCDLLHLASRGMYEDFAFLECIDEGRPAFPDFRTALKAHVAVGACYRSAEGSAEVVVANL